MALVVTDVLMPNRDGRQRLEIAHAQYPAIRFLCTSGSVDALQSASAFAAGTPYLQKPY